MHDIAMPLMAAILAAAAQAQSPARAGDLPLKHTPQPTHPEISAADLMTRLYIFADDSMEGRGYLTAGNFRATNYLAAELRKAGLTPAGDSGTYFQTLPTKPATYPARNVIAILRGTDPTLNHTYVAVGAHNDHLGIRKDGPLDHDSTRVRWLAALLAIKGTFPESAQDSFARAKLDSLRKLRPARPDSIWNGADDDGSGSVAVLEIAEAMAKLPTKPKRSILFILHNGEEGGEVNGANYFMENPTVPRDSIVAYVNLDMVGRGRPEDTGKAPDPNMLKPGRDVMVVGSRRMSTELGKLVETVNTAKGYNLQFDYDFDASTGGELVDDSDHYAYAKRGIPIVFFFTGDHVDYHQLTDEPQYVDYPHMEKITKFVYDLMLKLGTQPKRPVVDHPPIP